MKKKIIFAASLILAAAILVIPLISASAAVYVQDGKFRFQLYGDGTAAWAGYTSNTVDDVIVPRFYDTATVVGVANFGLQNNDKIKSVDFMEAPDLEKIGMYGFSGCSSLESVVVPSSITSIGVSAFRNCTALKTAEYYGNSNSVSVEAFYGCSALEKVRLSARLTSIQSLAFAGCSSLEYIEISDTVTYIASNAFDGDDNITLGVYYGSYAHQYAVDNNIDYYLIDGEPVEPTTGETTSDEPTTVESTEELTTDEPTTSEPATGELETTESTTAEPATFEPTGATTMNPATSDEPVLTIGDVNGDGIVDILDATMVQMFAAEKYIPTPTQFKVADVNRDGYVDVLDALIIQKHAVGLAVIE